MASLFIGRQAELAALGRAQQEVAAKRARLVALRGPAGIGKSALISSFLEAQRRARPEPRVDALRFDRQVPALAAGLAELVRTRFRVPAGASAQQVIDRLALSFKAENPFAEPGKEDVSRELFALVLGVSSPHFKTNALDPKSRWEAAHVELKRWLEGWSGRASWVIAIEDVQRGDSETAAFLQYAAKVPWAAAPLWLVSAREAELPAQSPWGIALERWKQEGLLVDLKLGGFEKVEEVLRQSPGLSAQAAAAAPVARGNPLLARLAASALARKEPLPGTLEEAALAELKSLPAPAQDAARRAAAIDSGFARAVAERLGASTDALRTLVSREVLVARGLDEYAFGSRVFFDAARGLISAEERREWDQQIATWARERIAALGPAWENDAAAMLPRIIQSLEAAGRAAEASLSEELLGLVLRRHGRPSDAASSFRKAAQHATGVRKAVLLRRVAEELLGVTEYTRALEDSSPPADFGPPPDPAGVPREQLRSLQELGQDRLDDWQTVKLEDAVVALDLARAEVLSLFGRTEETKVALEAIGARLPGLAGPIADHLWVTWARVATWFNTELLADGRASREVCDRLIAHLGGRTLDDQLDRLTFYRVQEIVASRSSQYGLALELLEKQLELAHRLKNVREELIAWNSKGICVSAVGKYRQARDCYRQSLDLARTVGARRREAVSLHNLGLIQHELGQYATARATQETYLELSRAIGNRVAEAYAPAAMASVALTAGDYDESARLCERARAVAEANGWRFLIAWVRALTGQAAMMKLVDGGQLEALGTALEDVSAGLQMLEEKGLHWTEEFDPGEHFAFLSLATALNGDVAAGKAVIARARANLPRECAVSWSWVLGAEALLDGRSPEEQRRWFKQQDAVRAGVLLDRLEKMYARHRKVAA